MVIFQVLSTSHDSVGSNSNLAAFKKFMQDKQQSKQAIMSLDIHSSIISKRSSKSRNVRTRANYPSSRKRKDKRGVISALTNSNHTVLEKKTRLTKPESKQEGCMFLGHFWIYYLICYQTWWNKPDECNLKPCM